MKFFEKLRMQATFSQILDVKELNDVKQNYPYCPYQSN